MTNNELPLVGNRRSQWFYSDSVIDPELAKFLATAMISTGFYEHMLSDDMRDLLPYGRGIDHGFRVEFEGSDRGRAEALVRSALSPHNQHSTIEQSVRTFVIYAAQLCVLLVNPTYEIEYMFRGGDSNDKPEAFFIHHIPPATIGRIRGQPIQYVPRDLSEATTRNGLAYVRLDPSRLVSITIPKDLRKRLGATIQFLRVASAAQKSEFLMAREQMANLGDFDFSEYNQLIGQFFYKGTRDVGWTSRELFDKHSLYPYVIWRYLQFLRFKIELRNAIVAGLNQILSVAGEQVGVECCFRIEGVLQVSDISQSEAHLKEGSALLESLTSF
ncbi:MAG TPA: hypothetical protein VGZ68_09410 [Acidimicrobiales bacterium]|jgi:hypothetical protein|nr:hypothetical protein [Acidimicrobiales bacterium]